MIDEKKLMQDFTIQQYKIPYEVFYDVIKRTVDKQPQVQQWIPCSEKMPEEGGRYLVWMDSIEEIQLEPFSARINEFGVYDFAGHSMDDEIIKPAAWMPLPEPYKAGE